ncbi:hypothetical protein [Flaviaesturariibacter amylovorans]|uniref:HTH luxR-type domain-containing protein n=1 Tax=Flaviaesturariibacter amylovorans TaxID=1084520 RepID=A0ABP8GP04_9BACT
MLLLMLTFCRQAAAQLNLDSLMKLDGWQRTGRLSIYLDHVGIGSPEFNRVQRYLEAKGTREDKIYLNYKVRLHQTGFPDARKDGYTAVKQLTDSVFRELGATGNHVLRADLFYTLGEAANIRFNPVLAFENKLYCLDELSTDPTGRFYDQSWCLYRIACDYYCFNDFESAALWASRAYHLNANGQFQILAEWFPKASSNLAGVAFAKTGQHDSSARYLQINYQLAEATRNKVWLGIASGYLGMLPYWRNHWDEAVPFLERGLTLCVENKLWDNVAMLSVALADCYLKTGQVSKTDSLLQLAKSAIYRQTETNPLMNPFPAFIGYFSLQSQLSLLRNDKQGYTRFADSAQLYESRQERVFSRDKKDLAEARMAVRHQALASEVAEQRARQATLRLWSVIAVGLLVVMLLILIVKRQKLRYRIRREELEHTRKLAEEKLNSALSDLKTQARLVEEKEELIGLVQTEIDALRAGDLPVPDAHLKRLEEIRSSVILTDDDWAGFKIKFEAVYPGFLVKLTHAHANLTQAETRYILLRKLKLTPKEMAAILGVGPEALRNVSFRLRKKLNVSDSEQLEELIERI